MTALLERTPKTSTRSKPWSFSMRQTGPTRAELLLRIVQRVQTKDDVASIPFLLEPATAQEQISARETPPDLSSNRPDAVQIRTRREAAKLLAIGQTAVNTDDRNEVEKVFPARVPLEQKIVFEAIARKVRLDGDRSKRTEQDQRIDRLVDFYNSHPDAAQYVMEPLLADLYPMVLSYCRARVNLSSGFSAEDITQDVLEAAIKKLPKYKAGVKPFTAFVFGIASHKIADSYRPRSRSARVEYMNEVPDVNVSGNEPEEHALRNERIAHLNTLVAELPENRREVILLRFIDGLSPDEIATKVGSSGGAVRVLLHRTLAKLRAKMPDDFNLWMGF